MVELEEIRVGYYFLTGKEPIQIVERDYSYLRDLSKVLTPIPITTVNATNLLHFNWNGGDILSHSLNGKMVYLKPNTHSYELQFDGLEKVRYVRFIHEVQDFWYGVFSELLCRKGYSPRPSKMPFGVGQFYFLPPLFIVTPNNFAMFILEECNYGIPLKYRGRNWALKVHMGDPDRDVCAAANAWFKENIADKEPKK